MRMDDARMQHEMVATQYLVRYQVHDTRYTTSGIKPVFMEAGEGITREYRYLVPGTCDRDR